MGFKRVKSGLQVAEIPETDGLVGRSCSQDCLRRRVERDGVDGIAMLALRRCSSACRVRLPNIDNLESNVVRYCTDEGGVERMVLNIVDNRRMMCIGFSRIQMFVPFSISVQVPAIPLALEERAQKK